MEGMVPGQGGVDAFGVVVSDDDICTESKFGLVYLVQGRHGSGRPEK